MSMTPGPQNEWYYVGHYGQLGPLTFEQIEELVRDGVIEKDTFVWQTGMGNWDRAGSIAMLSSVFAASSPYSSPPPPPLSMAAPRVPEPLGAPSYTSSYPTQTYGYPAFPTSDKNRAVAGILQILIPGAGRMYLGYWAQGVLQFVFWGCLIGWLWSLVDGIVILSGGVKLDGYGRQIPN